MASYLYFEELPIWQEARELVKRIYDISKENSELKKDFGLTNQIQKAAVSIISNIAEGFERGSNKDFIRFLTIAKSSCGELRSHLYVALDLKYIHQQKFKELQTSCIKLSQKISGFIRYLKNQNSSKDR